MDESERKNAVVMGGREIAVQFEDGTSETVTVRALKIKELGTYFTLIEDEIAMARFLVGKTEDKTWGEEPEIEFDSLEAILDAGEELNFDKARRWAERRAKTMDALLPSLETATRIQKGLHPSSQTSR